MSKNNLLFLLSCFYTCTTFNCSSKITNTPQSSPIDYTREDKHRNFVRSELQKEIVDHCINESDIIIFFTYNEAQNIYEMCSTQGKNIISKALLLYPNQQSYITHNLQPPKYSHTIPAKEEYF